MTPLNNDMDPNEKYQQFSLTQFFPGQFPHISPTAIKFPDNSGFPDSGHQV